MLRGLLKVTAFSPQSRLLTTAGIMLFFYALFDGLIAYILPIKITGLGYSRSQMGLIIGSSNVFGAIFDFFLAKFLTNTNYRRLFLICFGLCFVYPLFVWSSSTIPLFMISMAIWGLYGDLNLYATFDFVSRQSNAAEHCKSFGILGVLKSLGYLISPIIAGLIVAETIDFFPFSLALSFVLVAIIFYLLLVQFSFSQSTTSNDSHSHYHHYNFFHEFYLLKKIAFILFPVLLFTVTLYVFDAVFWTIGPIFSESYPHFPDFGGLFMAAYTLPVLIVNWFVNPITNRFGKKRTAYISFLLGSLLLLPITLITNPLIIIILVFLSSLLGSIAWPAIDGAYADYISESHTYEKEITSLVDFCFNIGYIIGPIFAGIVADLVGNRHVFAALAIVNIFIVLILMLVTPRHIKVVIHRK